MFEYMPTTFGGLLLSTVSMETMFCDSQQPGLSFRSLKTESSVFYRDLADDLVTCRGHRTRSSSGCVVKGIRSTEQSSYPRL